MTLGLRALGALLARVGRGGVLLAFITLLALANGARAGSAQAAPPASLAGLDAALVARLAAVPAPSAEEAAQLTEALASLRGYSGLLASYTGLDKSDPEVLRAVKQDMDRLVDVAGHIQASRTPDRNIGVHITAVRGTLADFGNEARQLALGTFPLLTDMGVVETLRALIARGEEQHQQGVSLFGTLGGSPAGRNYLAGARKLALAWSSHHSAARQAEKQRIREGNENPVNLEPMELMTPAEPPMAEIPFEVMAMVQLSNPAPEVTVAVRAIAVMDEPEGSPPPPQVTLGVKTFLDVPAGMQGLPVTVMVPPFTDESVKTLLVEGGSVAVEGNTAVIGRPNRRTAFSNGLQYGWASILERNAGGFGEWNEVARLEDGVIDSLFGFRVAISGDTIVIGAPGVASDKGAVYVYQRQGGIWALARTLVASDGATGDLFGLSVAIDGDWILVGAPDKESGRGRIDEFDTPRRGTAYTFLRDPADPTRWVQRDSLALGLEEVNFELVACLTPGSTSAVFPGLSDFGSAVALSGNLAIVGDPRCRVDYEADGCSIAQGPHPSGAAFVFERVGANWRAIPQRGWLGPRIDCSPLPVGPCRGVDVFSSFGASVAIADQTLVVGAPNYSSGGPAQAGVVRVYSGPNFTLTKTLQAPSPMAVDQFGTSVAISRHATPNDPSQMIVVGSPGHDHPRGGPPNAGSVYLFVRGYAPGCPTPMPQPGGWGLAARRFSEKPSPGGSGSGGGNFGHSVAVTTATSIAVPGGEDQLQEVAPTSIFVSENFEGQRAFHVMSGMEPVLPGEYWLSFELDPHDRILEVEDGAAGQNVMRSATPVTFCVDALTHADLAVDSVELVPIDPITGDGFIVMEKDNGEQLERAGLNVVVHMAGMFDGPLTGARLTARALGISGGAPVAFKIWNQTTGNYEPNLVLPDLSSGDTLALHLDVQLDRVTGLPVGSYDMSVEVTISSPVGDVVPDNNSKAQPGQDLRIFNFVSCNFAQMYKKQLGNDDFNVTIDFMGSVALAPDLAQVPGHGLFPDNLAEFGAIGALSGGADLTLMGSHLGRLVQFRALAERDPLQEYGFVGFDIQVRVPGSSSQVETVYAIGPYDSIDLVGIPPSQLPMGLEVVNGGFRITRTFSIAKSYEREKTFYPGGVPVTVAGRAVGSLGVTLGMELTDRLKFDVIPFVDFSAGVALALGNCNVLCVGADGEIVLVNDSFDMAAGVGMQIFDDGMGSQALGANACIDITNRITLLNGRINAFAIFPWFKWCSLFGVPVPCGFYLRREDFTIISWEGITSNQRIIRLSESLCCTRVMGAAIQCDPNNDVVCD